MEKEFLRMKLADLVPYENNPRHNEEAVDATIASMQQCGNIDPIEVDENNVILSGHTRRLALMKMGYEESDVVRVTGLTDLQKKKYRILANKTNEFAGWDFGKLEEELDGLDFEGFDFGLDFLNDDPADYFVAEPQTFNPEKITYKNPDENTNDPVNEAVIENSSVIETESDTEGAQVQCPHCGQWFTV